MEYIKGKIHAISVVYHNTTIMYVYRIGG